MKTIIVQIKQIAEGSPFDTTQAIRLLAARLLEIEIAIADPEPEPPTKKTKARPEAQ